MRLRWMLQKFLNFLRRKPYSYAGHRLIMNGKTAVIRDYDPGSHTVDFDWVSEGQDEPQA